MPDWSGVKPRGTAAKKKRWWKCRCLDCRKKEGGFDWKTYDTIWRKWEGRPELDTRAARYGHLQNSVNRLARRARQRARKRAQYNQAHGADAEDVDAADAEDRNAAADMWVLWADVRECFDEQAQGREGWMACTLEKDKDG